MVVVVVVVGRGVRGMRGMRALASYSKVYGISFSAWRGRRGSRSI